MKVLLISLLVTTSIADGKEFKKNDELKSNPETSLPRAIQISTTFPTSPRPLEQKHVLPQVRQIPSLEVFKSTSLVSLLLGVVGLLSDDCPVAMVAGKGYGEEVAEILKLPNPKVVSFKQNEVNIVKLHKVKHFHICDCIATFRIDLIY